VEYNLAVSNRGMYLILSARTKERHEVTVFRRDGAAYSKYGQALDIAPGKGPLPWSRALFLNDSTCILGWIQCGPGGVRFYSYVCDLAASRGEVKGILLEGLATQEPAAPDGSPRFRLTQLDSTSATTRVIQLNSGTTTDTKGK
jgi:hypothetical protein